MEYVLPELSRRLKILRTSYQLPVLEAEWVCGVSRSALNNWERGSRIPSADGLFQISTSFGVSIDWLFGLSQVPYTHDSITYAESIRRPYVTIKNIVGCSATSPIFDDASTKDYFDKSKRELYELSARANILVFTLYIKGWHKYFDANNGNRKIATIKQLDRLIIAENGLYSALRTKYPSANSLGRFIQRS